MYKIRLDGRKRSLHPPHLLQLFLDAQAGEFLKRFSQATKQLEADLGSVSHKLAQLENDVQGKLEQIFYSADNASSLADEAMVNSDDARGMIESLAHDQQNVPSEVEALVHKVDLLLDHFDIEDPQRTRLSEYLESVFARAKAEPSAEAKTPEVKPTAEVVKPPNRRKTTKKKSAR